MANLVGYGSSSDEDDDLTCDENGEVPEQVTSSTAAQQHNALKVADEAEAPMIGPSAPANGLNAADEELESNPSEPHPMSERDTIRLLTQTTHPMTSMPPSPPGSPNPAANARFRRFLELKTKGIHFNEDLASKTTFRNPSLLSAMMLRAGIEEDEQYGTSLVEQLWNPTELPRAGYKEQLLKSQQAIREREESNKRQLSAAGKRTIDFTSAGRSGNSSRDSTPGLINKRRKP